MSAAALASSELSSPSKPQANGLTVTCLSAHLMEQIIRATAASSWMGRPEKASTRTNHALRSAYLASLEYLKASSQMITSWTCWISRPSLNRLVDGHRLYRLRHLVIDDTRGALPLDHTQLCTFLSTFVPHMPALTSLDLCTLKQPLPGVPAVLGCLARSVPRGSLRQLVLPLPMVYESLLSTTLSTSAPGATAATSTSLAATSSAPTGSTSSGVSSQTAAGSVIGSQSQHNEEQEGEVASRSASDCITVTISTVGSCSSVDDVSSSSDTGTPRSAYSRGTAGGTCFSGKGTAFQQKVPLTQSAVLSPLLQHHLLDTLILGYAPFAAGSQRKGAGHAFGTSASSFHHLPPMSAGLAPKHGSIDAEGLELLSQLPMLRVLCVHGVNLTLDNSGIRSLGSMRRLEVLHATERVCLTRVTPPLDFSPLSHLTALTSLALGMYAGGRGTGAMPAPWPTAHAILRAVAPHASLIHLHMGFTQDTTPAAAGALNVPGGVGQVDLQLPEGLDGAAGVGNNNGAGNNGGGQGAAAGGAAGGEDWASIPGGMILPVEHLGGSGVTLPSLSHLVLPSSHLTHNGVRMLEELCPNLVALTVHSISSLWSPAAAAAASVAAVTGATAALGAHLHTLPAVVALQAVHGFQGAVTTEELASVLPAVKSVLTPRY